MKLLVVVVTFFHLMCFLVVVEAYGTKSKEIRKGVQVLCKDLCK